MGAVYNSYRAARSEYSIDQIPLPSDGQSHDNHVICIYINALLITGMMPVDIPMPDESS